MKQLFRLPLETQQNQSTIRQSVAKVLRPLDEQRLYQELDSMKDRQGQLLRIRQIVRHLHEDRGVPFNLRMFEALVVSNWDITGSAAELRWIQSWMEKEGKMPDSEFYHSALRVRWAYPLRRSLLLGEGKLRR
jgi:hypothetical protein